jgi:hypothetical protein
LSRSGFYVDKEYLAMLSPNNGATRRHRRWYVAGRLGGRIGRSLRVSFVNISLGGALIEHANVVPPGTVSFLTLSISGEEEALKCRVVRSFVHRYDVEPAGERGLIYRSGVEFLDTSETSLSLIDKSIESLKVAI